MSLVLRLPTGIERKLEVLWRGPPDNGAGRVDFATPAGEPALIPAQSVSWRVFKNPVTMFIGGVAAVILELAEPRVRTGVWEHSRFRKDPVGRLRRTGTAAMITVYGPRSIAMPMIERVARMHTAISGVTPCGVAFTAADPALLTWVHATASYGFVAAYAEYARPLGRAEIDAFFEEGAPAAHLYGAADAPRSMRELESLFTTMRGGLRRSAILLEFLDLLHAAPVLPRPLAWVQGLLIRAAVDIVPPWARERLGLDTRRGLQVLERRMVKSIAGLADRIVLPGGAPAQSCVRLGLPVTYLYGPQSWGNKNDKTACRT
jgi:uncharacterized protein (DUF2236 family)